jgi:disulfide bond formation protein DsbB
MIKKSHIFIIVFLFSLTAMSFAFILQYAYGHNPCKLCVYQRIPYYLILVLGIFYFFIKKYFKFVYHSLTTFGFIEYTGCEAASLPTDINKLKEELMSNSLITTCSDANLPYFGIPLSVYNFLFSITFLILIIFNAYKKEK